MEDRKYSDIMRRKLSELGAVRELELHYGIVLKEPLISFGVREWPTEEHRIHSIARAGRDKGLADALRIADCLMGDLFRWLGPGQGRTTKVAELDRDTVEELRGLLAKHAALPTISSGWVTWPCPGLGEEPQDVGVEVFLPSQRGGDNRGRAVLHPGLGKYFAKFEMLGMKRVDVADETVSSPPRLEPATVTPLLEVKGDLDGTALVEALRTTMAYIQLWLYELHPSIYQAVDRRSDRLEQWSIREAEELVLGGRQLVAHLAAAAAVLYVRAGTRGMGLRPALAFLIRNPAVLGLGDKQGAATAEALAMEVAIRLVEATQPGKAAVNVMRGYGLCSEAPPDARQLRWWFGKAPLALEEVESKTVASRRPAKAGEAERGASASDGFALTSGPTSGPKSTQADAADGCGLASGSSPGQPSARSDAGRSRESGSDPGQALVAALRGVAEVGETADLWSQVARHAKQPQEMGRAAGEAFGEQAADIPATAEDVEEDPWARWARNRAAGIDAAAPESEGREEEAPGRPVRGSAPDTSSSSSGPSAGPGHQPKSRDEVSGPRPAGGLPAPAPWAAEEALSLQEDLAKMPQTARELASRAGRLRTWAEERLAHHVQLSLLQYLDVDSDALLDVPPGGFAVPTQGRLCAEDERQVASWGERWVFHYLKRKYADQPNVEVKWLNDEEEQFEFYDVVVRFPNGAQDCYEVKTTITGDNKPMEVSERQVLEAAKLKQRFNFVRVFGAGGTSPKMLLIPNPSSQWLQKASTGVQLLVKLP
ncbi:unnamed protein product [Symbiodinium sp. CCMP2456]|nr:unnamed protein product [Symbiodinium sp. CCMP2456]